MIALTAEPRPAVLWEHRTYPGDFAHLHQVRADLATDLAGFDLDLIDTLQLVTSELWANAVKYTDSGQDGGEVIPAWGHFRLAPWADLGTHVWATFAVGPGKVPKNLRSYVFTR